MLLDMGARCLYLHISIVFYLQVGSGLIVIILCFFIHFNKFGKIHGQLLLNCSVKFHSNNRWFWSSQSFALLKLCVLLCSLLITEILLTCFNWSNLTLLKFITITTNVFLTIIRFKRFSNCLSNFRSNLLFLWF